MKISTPKCRVFLTTCLSLCLFFSVSTVAQTDNEQFSKKLADSPLPKEQKAIIEQNRAFQLQRQALESRVKRGEYEAYKELGDLYSRPGHFQNKSIALNNYKKALEHNIPNVKAQIEKLTHQSTKH